MHKINGYTEEEARTLVKYITEGKRKGKTLTYLFETYGLQYGRAKGSVRNYYYELMKNEKGDERIVRLLDGTSLSVEKSVSSRKKKRTRRFGVFCRKRVREFPSVARFLISRKGTTN